GNRRAGATRSLSHSDRSRGRIALDDSRARTAAQRFAQDRLASAEGWRVNAGACTGARDPLGLGFDTAWHRAWHRVRESCELRATFQPVQGCTRGTAAMSGREGLELGMVDALAPVGFSSRGAHRGRHPFAGALEAGATALPARPRPTH